MATKDKHGNDIHVDIDGDYSQVQIGATGGMQSIVHAPSETSRRHAIEDFVNEYYKNLNRMKPGDRYRARQYLQTVEDHLKSGPVTPRNTALREALLSLRSIAEGATGGAIFAGLVELANRIQW